MHGLSGLEVGYSQARISRLADELLRRHELPGLPTNYSAGTNFPARP